MRTRNTSRVLNSHRNEQPAEGGDSGERGWGGGGERVQLKGTGMPWSSGAMPEARSRPASVVKAAQRAEGGSRGSRAGATSSIATVVAGRQPAP